MIPRAITGTLPTYPRAAVRFRQLQTFLVDDATYLSAEYSVTTDAYGDFAIGVPVPDTGTVAYLVELPDGTAIGVNLGAGAATTLELLLAGAFAVGSAPDVLILLQSLVDTHALITASTTVLGHVKIDGTTITIDGAGVISSAAGGGVTDHGVLTGLSDDDHPQYLTTARGDLRYEQVFSIAAYGATQGADCSAAVIAAIAAAQAVGGAVFIPAGTWRVDSQLLLPNNGATPPAQRPIRIFGAGALFSGRGTAPLGGSILDLRYSGANAKIVTLGLGALEIDHLTLIDGSTSSTPYILTTNTTLHIHHTGFYGNKSGVLADQDAIVLGGTNLVEGGSDPNDGFQGYGTVIASNFFARIRRAVYGRTYANGVIVRDNTLWSNCGTNLAGGSAIEFAGAASSVCAGNVVIANVIETTNYPYAIMLSNAERNTIAHNNIYDDTAIALACVYFGSNARYNLLIDGFRAGTLPGMVDTTSANTYITMAQSEISLFTQPQKFLNKVTLAGGTQNVIIQPETPLAADSNTIFEIFRSATDATTPGASIYRFRQDGKLEIGGALSGTIDFASVAFETAGRTWHAKGVGAAMMIDTGTGGSNFDLKAFAFRMFDHLAVLHLRYLTASDKFEFGVLADTNLYRSAADTLKTDDKFIAAALVGGGGVTGSRPASPTLYQEYYDTTIGKPVWWNGSAWKDATGATV